MPKQKRKPKKKENLTSRKPQKETTQPLTKERGGGREKPKEATEWLNALAGYRYLLSVSTNRRWSSYYSSTEPTSEMSSKMRSEMSDLDHVCYESAHLSWSIDPWSGSSSEYEWLSSLNLNLCPSEHTSFMWCRLICNDHCETEWRCLKHVNRELIGLRVSGTRIDWDRLGRVIDSCQWLETKDWIYETGVLSDLGVNEFTRLLVIIRPTMKKQMGLRPNTQFGVS